MKPSVRHINQLTAPSLQSYTYWSLQMQMIGLFSCDEPPPEELPSAPTTFFFLFCTMHQASAIHRSQLTYSHAISCTGRTAVSKVNRHLPT